MLCVVHPPQLRFRGISASCFSICGPDRSVREDVQLEERADGGSPGKGSHVYADVVRINGTEFHEDPRGSLMYKDKNGGVLDMNFLKY